MDIFDTDKIYEFVSGLNQGMERYCTKMIIVSDPKDLKRLFSQIIRFKESELVSCPLYLYVLDETETIISEFIQETKRNTFDTSVMSAKITDVIDILDQSDQDDILMRSMRIMNLGQYTDILKSFVDIDDLVMGTQVNGYKFYSNRDISRLKRIKYKSLHLTVIINNVTEKSIIDGTFNKLFLYIKNQLNCVNPMENDYIIGNVEYKILVPDHISDTSSDTITQYINTMDLGSDNKLFKSTASLHSLTSDAIIEMDKIRMSLKNRQVENLPKVMHHMMFLYSLYKFQEQCNLNETQTDYIMIFGYLNQQSLDQISQINISGEMDRAIKQKLQYIAVHNTWKSLFILGTNKIMSFFMLLYQYYGYYKPWLNVRRFQTNGMMSSTEYYKYDKSQYMDYKIQMIEHIMHFTDVMMTSIQKVIVPETQTRIVIIIGTQIPESLDSKYMIDDRFMIHQICIDAMTDNDVITSYQDLTKNNTVVCVLFWRYSPNIELLTTIDYSVRLFHLQYRSDSGTHTSIDSGTHTSIDSGTHTSNSNEGNVFNGCEKLIIEDTTMDPGIGVATEASDIKSFPLCHQYIDTTIGTQYTTKEDILSDITIFISEQSDDLYKSIINVINESDVSSFGTVNIFNYNDDNQMIQSIKHSRIIITSDPKICLMGMCYRTVVIMYRSEQTSDSYMLRLEKPSRVVKQLKVVLGQSRINSLNTMIDEAYCVASKLSWRRFFVKNILDRIDDMTIE
jgi:hypothetical protein